MTAAAALSLALFPLSAQQTRQINAAFQRALSQAQVELAAHHYGQARKLFERANKLMQGGSSACYAGEAAADLRLQKYKDAAKAATRAYGCATSTHAQAGADNLLGLALMQRAAHERNTKWLPQAIAGLQTAAKLDPASGAMHFNLGIALLRDRQVPAGENQLQRFLALAPSDASAPLARRYLANPASAMPGYWPEFAITAANGQIYAPRSLAGKVVLLDFWGSWCPPCRESVGELRGLWRQYSRSPFVLVSVDVGDKQTVWQQYVTKHKMTWPQYWDGKAYAMERTFDVHEFPTFVVADGTGVIRLRVSGEGPDETEALESTIHSLLKQLAAAPRG